jgi:Tol biopolymer transport system component
MNLEKKTEAFLVHPGLHNCGNPAWSADGNYLIGAQGGAHFIKLNAEKNGVEKVTVVDSGHPCNNEISFDGKYWTYVVDTDGCLGGWLCYRQLDYEKLSVSGGGEVPLGQKRGSVNYYPAFSPDGKYYVYAHAEQQAGVKSWEIKGKQELYVTRFPKCEATVRVTWNGAGNMHPCWAAK